jgi:hypothetical protein
MRAVRFAVVAGVLLPAAAIFAQTGCEGLPKPAEGCATGQSYACVADGGEHWECVQEQSSGTGTEPVVAAEPERPASVTETAIAPTAAPAPTTPAPAAPSPAAPQPATTAVQPVTQQPPAEMPVETPMPMPSPEPVPLEDILALVEEAAEVAPQSLQPWLYAAAGALVAVIAMLGIQEFLRRRKDAHAKKCARCGGTGRESTSETCGRCEGEGTIEEEVEAEGACPHCEGEGEDPCHECEGEGEKDGPDGKETACEACAGTGKAFGKDGEPVDCCTCGGIGEASGTLTKRVTCPDCEGAKVK